MTQALAPIAETSDLVATIERARALLDDGDLTAARLIAVIAYDQAKAGVATAEKVKASRQLIDKARQMQADALYVETQATIRMADVIDDAQAKGQVSRGGRPKTVVGNDGFTLDQFGIDRDQLYQARKVRNAERANPGFVTQIIKARLAEGLEPSRAALKRAAGHAIGTMSASKDDRGADLYETPIEAIRTLLALESFSATVLEPSVGRGAILRPLEEAGYEVKISDLHDRGVSTRHGEVQQVGDFLRMQSAIKQGADIITNPPFGIANAYSAHALREFKPQKMALLLNLNFMCGFDDADRRFVMDENPPIRVYVFTRRLPMMHRDGWTGPEASSQMNCGWFVWDRNDDGSYGQPGRFETIRVDWKAFDEANALLPGAGGHVAPLTFAPEVDEFARETPRKTVDERVGEEMERARQWVASGEIFDAGALRKGIAVRPIVADALIADLLETGAIEVCDGGYQASAAIREVAA